MRGGGRQCRTRDPKAAGTRERLRHDRRSKRLPEPPTSGESGRLRGATTCSWLRCSGALSALRSAALAWLPPAAQVEHTLVEEPATSEFSGMPNGSLPYALHAAQPFVLGDLLMEVLDT
jgi:hypothetical protein